MTQVDEDEDVTTSYELRFRDPAFDVIWTRWQDARSTWGRVWEGLDFSLGGPDSRYNPEPSKIPDPVQRAAAQEYIDARVAYKAEIARRN
jgi:hypothetical protein